MSISEGKVESEEQKSEDEILKDDQQDKVKMSPLQNYYGLQSNYFQPGSIFSNENVQNLMVSPRNGDLGLAWDSVL